MRPRSSSSRSPSSIGPNRVSIARDYSEDEVRQSVSDIAEHFDVSLSTVSHHLKELRTAGLITCEKRGKTVYCSHDPDALARVERFVEGMRASSGGRAT